MSKPSFSPRCRSVNAPPRFSQITKLLLAFLLLAVLAAVPWRGGAQEVKVTEGAPVPAKSSGGQIGKNRLTLIQEEKNRPDVVHFVSYHGGASRAEPSFGLWAPTGLRTEYDAIPTEAGKFAWLADHFREQLENGDILSGNDLGILHLYGLGVEKDWKKAQDYFVEPVKHGRFVGQRYLAELLVLSPEQPQNARLAGELIIPLLQARDWMGNWAAL